MNQQYTDANIDMSADYATVKFQLSTFLKLSKQVNAKDAPKPI